MPSKERCVAKRHPEFVQPDLGSRKTSTQKERQIAQKAIDAEHRRKLDLERERKKQRSKSRFRLIVERVLFRSTAKGVESGLKCAAKGQGPISAYVSSSTTRDSQDRRQREAIESAKLREKQLRERRRERQRTGERTRNRKRKKGPPTL